MYDGATRVGDADGDGRDGIVAAEDDPHFAKSFVATGGLGKMRHLEVKFLWLQGGCAGGQVAGGEGERRH